MKVTSKKDATKLALDLGAELVVEGETFNRARRDEGRAMQRIEEKYLEVPGTNAGPTALQRLSAVETKATEISQLREMLDGLQKIVAGMSARASAAELASVSRTLSTVSARADQALQRANAAAARPIPAPVVVRADPAEAHAPEGWRFKIERDPLDNLDAVVATSASGRVWRFEFRRSHGDILGFTATPLTD